MQLMGCRSTVEPVCIRIIVHRHAVLRDHLRALRAAMTFEAAARKRTQRNAIEARQTIAMLGMIYLILVSLLPHSIPLPASGKREEIFRTPGVGRV